jgi:VWFA-related protein
MINLPGVSWSFSHRTLPSCCLLVLSWIPFPSGKALAQSASQPSEPSSSPVIPAQSSSSEMAVKEETTTSKMAESAQFHVNVRLVLARVVVRDSRGRAIGNLRKEDFELLDNGKPQVLSNFDMEHVAAQPRAGPAAASTAPADSSKPAEPPTLPVRYVAYLFDDLHLSFENINLFRAAAERRMDALPPTDRVALFSTSGQVAIDFTDDPVKLHRALESLEPRSGFGRSTGVDCPNISLYMADLIANQNDPTAMETALNEAVACQHGSGAGPPPSTAYLRGLAVEVLNEGQVDSRLVIGVLKSALRRLMVMPGQRSLILISPGFLTPQLEYDYDDLIDRALRGQVVISSLDARGLYVIIPYGDASQRGTADQAVGQFIAPPSRTQLDLAAASADSDILSVLAYGTGGNFFHNNNDMDEGFGLVADAPEWSYVLGFTPQNLKTDGKFHTLKINLKIREKYDVQARRGYYAPARAVDQAEQAKREIEDEVLSSEELHDLPVALHTQFFKVSDDSARLTVLARVDVKRLHYKQLDNRNQNELTVVTALFDRNGNILHSEQKLVTMRWKDETLQNKLASGITLRSSFDVKPGRYLVRVVARDTQQQLMAAENGAVEIP